MKGQDIKERIDGIKEKSIDPVNYPLLEGEFVCGPYDTVAQFARAKGLDKVKLTRHSVGWAKKRKEYIKNTTQKMMEHDMEHKVMNITQVKYILSDKITKLNGQWDELEEERKNLIARKEDLDSREKRPVKNEKLNNRTNSILNIQRQIEKSLAVLVEKFEKFVKKGSLAATEAQSAEIQKLEERAAAIRAKYKDQIRIKKTEGTDEATKKVDTA